MELGVGGVEVVQKLATLTFGNLLCSTHFIELDQPIAELRMPRFDTGVWDACQRVHEVGKKGLHLVHSTLLEFKGIHCCYEVLNALSHTDCALSGVSVSS